VLIPRRKCKFIRSPPNKQSGGSDPEGSKSKTCTSLRLVKSLLEAGSRGYCTNRKFRRPFPSCPLYTRGIDCSNHSSRRNGIRQNGRWYEFQQVTPGSYFEPPLVTIRSMLIVHKKSNQQRSNHVLVFNHVPHEFTQNYSVCLTTSRVRRLCLPPPQLGLR